MIQAVRLDRPVVIFSVNPSFQPNPTQRIGFNITRLSSPVQRSLQRFLIVVVQRLVRYAGRNADRGLAHQTSYQATCAIGRPRAAPRRPAPISMEFLDATMRTGESVFVVAIAS